jgi:ABC-type uncharacterized transport system involved in gliding motility auxiliary subunit
MDENCFRQMANARMGGGETPIYFAPIIKDAFIDNDIDYMRGIRELVVLKASPLEMDKKRLEEHGLKASKLFSSSEKSWEMSGRINLDPRFIHPPPLDEMQSFPLAYMIEGEFPSYFDGKPIPEKEADEAEEEGEKKDKTTSAQEPQVKIEGTGEIITKGRPAKIFVMATSEVLKNNMVDEEGRSSNATFIMNVLDALNGRNEIAVMRSKEQRFNPLAETAPAVKTFIKAFNIAGLPVLVVAFGLLVLFRRHSRQKNIQSIFQK